MSDRYEPLSSWDLDEVEKTARKAAARYKNATVQCLSSELIRMVDAVRRLQSEVQAVEAIKDAAMQTIVRSGR